MALAAFNAAETKLAAGQVARIAAEGGWLFRPLDQIVMTGADRVRFLNGQVTCDVKSPLAPALAYGYFTTGKGRVESEVTVLIEKERLRLLLPPGQGEPILARLRKYLIADRVELSHQRIAGRWLVGPAARRGGLDGALPEQAWSWPNLGLGRDLACRVELPGDGGGPPAPLAGLGEVSEAAYQQLRIEAGRAEFGSDFGLDHFPQEIGVDEAVSYTKGCYLGQEIVARIHYRGGVQRHLRGLKIAAEAPLPSLPLALRLEGQEVGRLTSVAPLPRGGHLLGLGIVHKKAEPGASLELAGADGERVGTAELVALPFT